MRLRDCGRQRGELGCDSARRENRWRSRWIERMGVVVGAAREQIGHQLVARRRQRVERVAVAPHRAQQRAAGWPGASSPTALPTCDALDEELVRTKATRIVRARQLTQTREPCAASAGDALDALLRAARRGRARPPIDP